jgi:diguanylate cyclase (GGDEF)-like protein
MVISIRRMNYPTIRLQAAKCLAMIQLDPRTIVFFSSVLAALMTLILLTLRSSFGQHLRGMLAWAAGTALFSIASALYALRGQWHELLTIVLGNGLFMAAACYWTAGTLRFYGVNPRPRLLVLTCAAITLLIWWFLQVSPNYQVRLMVFTATGCVLYAIQAFVSARYGERHAVSWFFTGSLMVSALFMFVRFVSGAFALEPNAHFLSEDWVQICYLLFANSVPLLLSTGFFMVASRKIQSQLNELSRHDSLTGILNRRAFLEQCNTEQARHLRHQRPLSMILIDIDHFKKVNDTYGHAAGDAVLIGVCDTVQALLRNSDALGRIGGEEFAILLPETGITSAHTLAERIRNGVAETKMMGGLEVTLSLGVTTFSTEYDRPQDAMRRADTALYQAKSEGRNRTVLALA